MKGQKVGEGREGGRRGYSNTAGGKGNKQYRYTYMHMCTPWYGMTKIVTALKVKESLQ